MSDLKAFINFETRGSSRKVSRPRYAATSRPQKLTSLISEFKTVSDATRGDDVLVRKERIRFTPKETLKI